MGYKVMIWNVIPAIKETGTDLNPVNGSLLERNRAARLFNDVLRHRLPDEIIFLDIFDKLVDKETGIGNKHYFRDNIHLSQRAIPIALEELRFKGIISG